MGLTGLNLAESENLTNYEKEEKKLFEVSYEIQKMISEMEKKINGDE